MSAILKIRRQIRRILGFADDKHYEIAIALTLLVVGIGLRLAPHPPNFAPVTAIAIFGGAVLPRKLAVWTPLTLMIVSDAIIGFHSLIAVTWGCYALTALASSRWLRRASLTRTAVFTLVSSVSFYIVTNFAVWMTSGMYVHTWAGLEQCYVLALPFFHNSLASDVLYTAALFVAYRSAISARRGMAAGYDRQLPL